MEEALEELLQDVRTYFEKDLEAKRRRARFLENMQTLNHNSKLQSTPPEVARKTAEVMRTVTLDS